METGTIAFLTTAHSLFDDRIFYHQAKSLVQKFNVLIVSSAEDAEANDGNITVKGRNLQAVSKKEKIDFFIRSLEPVDPLMMICSEPLAVYAAYRYKRKFRRKRPSVVYDITEWYPSKKNLDKLSNYKRIPAFLKLLFFNVFAASHCSGFIFGEYYKSLPFRFLFPCKKWILLTYYPDLAYINYRGSAMTPNRICLGYTGKISREKGIANFFAVANTLKNTNPDIAVKLKIIGWCVDDLEKKIFDDFCDQAGNIEIELLGKQNFEIFSDRLSDVDILFDLRETDFENNHCLPIKIFYYAACGKPVIYSDLKAIKREIDVSQFGYLVKPTDAEAIARYVTDYLRNPGLFIRHSRAARKLAETKYNWKLIEPQFLDFIKRLQL